MYEFLTEFHLGKGDQQSALVTSEKAYDVFKGWGQPYMQYCKLLRDMAGRELEMRDAALAALRTPLWTVALEQEDLDLVLGAAKSSRVKAQEKFWKLYEDERLQEIKQGKRPEQVALDRAAFLMDAALLGANVCACLRIYGGAWRGVSSTCAVYRSINGGRPSSHHTTRRVACCMHAPSSCCRASARGRRCGSRSPT